MLVLQIIYHQIQPFWRLLVCKTILIELKITSTNGMARLESVSIWIRIGIEWNERIESDALFLKQNG